ncbi:ABC transporter ATP-binding protein [Vulcanisaeta distributa]|uniref:ATP-binding cassette domain-containing protein n=1 Tax=Vulcanisaeta distributa TaxID=164451 RepID=UPI000A3E572E|nr:ABC transporter ATP-binding protein [Vulcanisaeta distributa]
MRYEGVIDILGMGPPRPEVMNNVGAVLETPLVLETLSPRDFLEFVGSVRGVRDSRYVETLVRALGLEEFIDKPIMSLSAGNRQKVAIVAALMHRPRLLLMDEPFNYLDTKSVRIVKELMQRHLESGGGSILFTTHIMEVAERVCTRIGIINAGRLIVEGTPMEIMNAVNAGSLEDAFLRAIRLRTRLRLIGGFVTMNPWELGDLVYRELLVQAITQVRRTGARPVRIDRVVGGYRVIKAVASILMVAYLITPLIIASTMHLRGVINLYQSPPYEYMTMYFIILMTYMLLSPMITSVMGYPVIGDLLRTLGLDEGSIRLAATMAIIRAVDAPLISSLTTAAAITAVIHTPTPPALITVQALLLGLIGPLMGIVALDTVVRRRGLGECVPDKVPGGGHKLNTLGNSDGSPNAQ